MFSQVAFTVIRKISIESSEKRHRAPNLLAETLAKLLHPLQRPETKWRRWDLKKKRESKQVREGGMETDFQWHFRGSQWQYSYWLCLQEHAFKQLSWVLPWHRIKPHRPPSKSPILFCAKPDLTAGEILVLTVYFPCRFYLLGKWLTSPPSGLCK